MTDTANTEVENRFESIQLNDDTVKKVTTMRNHISSLAKHIDKTCANSREKSIALTKLEECGMWVTKCLSRNQ